MSDDLDKLVAEAQPADDLDSLVANAKPLDAAPPADSGGFGSWLKSAAKSVAEAVPRTIDPMRVGETLAEDPLGSTRAALMGATYGMAPRMLSGIEAATGRDYNDALAENQPAYLKAEGEHPGIAMGGALASPNPFGKMGALGRLAPVGRVALGAATGGLTGWAHQPVGSPSAMDAATGDAEAGAAISAGLEALPAVGKAAPWLLRLGRSMNLKSLGGTMADVRNLNARFPGRANQVADFVAREGIAPPLSTAAGAKERLGEFLDSGGKRFGDVLDMATAAGVKVDGDRAASSLRALGADLDPVAQKHWGSVAADAADTVQQAGTVPISTANRMKGSFQKLAKYDSRNQTPAVDLSRDIARQYRDEMLTQAGEQAPGLRPTLEQMMSDLSLAKDADKLAKNGVARQSGNRAFGLSENLAALNSTTAMGKAMLAFGANVARNAGPSVAAPLLRNASSAASGIAAARSIGTPAATSAAARKLWEWYGVAPKDDEDISRTHADKQLPGL